MENKSTKWKLRSQWEAMVTPTTTSSNSSRAGMWYYILQLENDKIKRSSCLGHTQHHWHYRSQKKMQAATWKWDQYSTKATPKSRTGKKRQMPTCSASSFWYRSPWRIFSSASLVSRSRTNWDMSHWALSWTRVYTVTSLVTVSTLGSGSAPGVPGADAEPAASCSWLSSWATKACDSCERESKVS